MKKIFRPVVTFTLLMTALNAFSQHMAIEIANCNGDDKVSLFHRQVGWVMYSLNGNKLFRENAKLNFSDSSTVNLDSLEKKAVWFRKLLPKNYLSEGVGAYPLDTKPNKDGHIWFESVYADENPRGQIVVYAACKVIFEGTDPLKEQSNPKIRDVRIILDKTELNKLRDTIKLLLVANHVTLPAPEKKNQHSKEEALPPQIQ